MSNDCLSYSGSFIVLIQIILIRINVFVKGKAGRLQKSAEREHAFARRSLQRPSRALARCVYLVWLALMVGDRFIGVSQEQAGAVRARFAAQWCGGRASEALLELVVALPRVCFS